MNPFTQIFTAPFPILQLTLKATLLLALFFSIWMLFRRKSAAFRHSILVLALISVPLLLIAQLTVPSQELPWLEQNVVSNFEDAFEFSSDDEPRNSRLYASNANSEPAPEEAEAQPDQSIEIAMEPHSETPDGEEATISLSEPSGVFFWSVKKTLVIVWLLVAAALLFRFALAWLIVWNIVRRSPRLSPDDLDPSISNLINEYSSAGCTFRLHRDSGQMPLCFGLVQHSVLLPQEFGSWSIEDQRSVIMHESAHAWRRDCLINFLAHIESAVLWFHPLSWALLRCLKSESEMACDDWAISRGINNVNYASALFDVTMSTKRKPTVAMVSVSMADCSPLERRMQSILASGVSRKPISTLGHIAIAALSVSLVTLLSAFHLGSEAIAQDSAVSNMKTEHRILMKDGGLVRGRLTGAIKLETSYGNATLDLSKLRSVKRLESGKHQILTDDDSTLTGIIRQNKFTLEKDGLESRIKVSEFERITTIGNANLVPQKITSGFLKDGISYHIRAPEGYQPAQEYPAIFFLHDANSNSRSMVKDFVKMCPDVANQYVLVGINGQNRSATVDDGFNWTYIDFAGRSKYKGFPGTDRQSPALVAESIVDLKDRIPISTVALMGEGNGAFLGLSVVMNFPELIDGVIATNGGFLIQTAPEAYENPEVIAAQKRTPITLIHHKPGVDHEKSHTWNAVKSFRKTGYGRHKFYHVKDERAFPKVLTRELRRFEKGPDIKFNW